MRHAGVGDRVLSVFSKLAKQGANWRRLRLVRVLVAGLLIFMLEVCARSMMVTASGRLLTHVGSRVPRIRSVAGIGLGSFPVARRRSTEHHTHQERSEQRQWERPLEPEGATNP
jgi:hypothetical protein